LYPKKINIKIYSQLFLPHFNILSFLSMLPQSIRDYAKLIIQNRKKSFIPGETHVPVA
jgi:hypothetical protein